MALPKILVTGATGKTGSAVIAELLARNYPVRAVVRVRDARAEALARRGVEVAVADLFDAEQMAVAMQGVQRAYYCPPISPYASAMIAPFMHAAEQNRLESVASMTQWLASASHPTLMTRAMWDTEQLLPLLKGAAVTILNPGFFADNYLRVSLGMAAQLGRYPNLVGDSKNAPPSNEDMARVAAAVLADPARHGGQRYRITGPDLIGVQDIVATLSRVLGRKVRAIDVPEWLLNKVAAFRGEHRYSMAVLHHYLEGHRQGAFAHGGPTDAVLRTTGKPVESFETTVRRYATRPDAQRSFGNFRRVLAEFMLSPLQRGYDHERLERQLQIPRLERPRYSMQDERWKASHPAQPPLSLRAAAA